MAVAAFKSTTKRSCNIGGRNLPDGGSCAGSQPTTPTGERGHRRSRSLSDFNSRYLSDFASAGGDSSYSHLDSIFQRARSARHQSSDSESDADSVYSRYTVRSRSSASDFGGGSRGYRGHAQHTKGTRQGGLRRSTSNISESSLKGLRRSSSHRDLHSSDSPVDAYYRRGYRHGDDQASRDHPEEEKTIRAVHTQKKEPSARDLDAISLYDAMRAEMRKAVSDIRNELEQVTFRGELYQEFSSAVWEDVIEILCFKLTCSKCGRDVAFLSTGDGNKLALTTPNTQIVIVTFSSFVLSFYLKWMVSLCLGCVHHLLVPLPHYQTIVPTSRKDIVLVSVPERASSMHSKVSVGKDLVLPTPSSFPGGLRITIPGTTSDEVDNHVAEIRREYAAKLEQSEKRAHDLWTQLAVEERRCLDLVKVVKELVPSQPGSRSKARAPPPSKPVLNLGPDVEKQLVSKSLDEDAQRYFDECVSISGLDPMSVNEASSIGIGKQGDESPIWSVKDVSFSPQKKDMVRTSEKKTAVLQPLITFCAQIEQTGKCSGKSKIPVFQKSAVNDDGLVLPWLQWETGLEFLPQEYYGKDAVEEGSRIATLTASSSSRSLTSQKSLGQRDSRHRSAKENRDSQSLDLALGVSGLGCFPNGDLSCWKSVEFGYFQNVGVSSIYEKGREEGRFDVENFVLQRMWLRQRLKQGRILVCGGMR